MKYFLLPILALFTACSPKLIVKKKSEAYEPIQDHEPFALLGLEDSLDLDESLLVATVTVKDAGLTLFCDYHTVLDIALRQARTSGGNLMKILEHREPYDFGSSCHQIYASVYRVPDARKFEKEINWHPQRRLEKTDFKGAVDKRPFTAKTSSRIRYSVQPPKLGPGEPYIFEVETVFDCRSSYFKETEKDSMVLVHEQIHFDMTELYARKFVREIEERVEDYQDFDTHHTRIFHEVHQELSIKQDEFDAEAYKDFSKNRKWSSWVSEELGKLEFYKNKTLEITGR